MHKGYAAYGKTHKSSLKGRALEGEAFMKAANMLINAQSLPENKRMLGEALQYTQKLWTIVQADLKSSANTLDDAMKSNLLSLSLYVDRTCYEIIKKPHQPRLQGLIDVNKNVAAGLLNRD
ncbi:MAG: flagellar protein FlaF [Methylocystaceae bacterium]|nr:flagellar protein FlaF [Methylocystaceae bacterium]